MSNLDPTPELAAVAGQSHACAYCGVSDAHCVVRCVTCDRWFCNSGSATSGSHIVNHLVISKHKVVALHPELPLGADTLECYNCGLQNIFTLGFVAARQDLVVVILCRVPCAQSRDINWETNAWQPLIEERRLLPWVASEAPKEQDALQVPEIDSVVGGVQNIDYKQIVQLEAQWRKNKDASISDVISEAPEAPALQPVLLRYTDGAEYQRTLAPLVFADMECSRLQAELQSLQNLEVEWDTTPGTYGAGPTLCFSLSNADKSMTLMGGGHVLVLVKYHGSASEHQSWSCHGQLQQQLLALQLPAMPLSAPARPHTQFVVHLHGQEAKSAPTHLNNGFSVSVNWHSVPYTRQQNALLTFATKSKSISGYLYHRILGHEVAPLQFSDKVPTKLSAPRLTQLNESQAVAAASALILPLTLIQGPPGTGKTVTSASIVYQLCMRLPTVVLVCAPSNVAVDHLAEKIGLTGLRVVRVSSMTQEANEDNTQLPYALHKLVEAQVGKVAARIKKARAAGENISDKQAAKMRSAKQIEKQILLDAQVICCTCTGAADARLKHFKFRSVLIDEITQASEPEALIPITRGAKQVILVGDHQQLGPVVLDRACAAAGLEQSLFERLIAVGHVPHRLEVQYRMHPKLAEFSSNVFYEGSLQNGVSLVSRSWKNLKFPWPVAGIPTMFWASYGKEEISPSGVSFLNRVEAMNAEKVISKLVCDGVPLSSIGVITPYEGQRSYIEQYLRFNSPVVGDAIDELEIMSVNAFQGREKDFIILSCVRGNDSNTIGFVSDPRRLNVAITRAKYGLMILGNPRSLSKNKLWRSLLLHYRENGVLVEGPLENLHLSLVPLSTPQTNKSGFLLNKIKPSGFSFDTQSMLSFADVGGFDGSTGANDNENVQDADTAGKDDDEFINGSQWPSLTHNAAMKMVEPNTVSSTGFEAVEGIDIRDIAGAFASGLQI